MAAVGFEGVTEKCIVAGQGLAHALRVLLPKMSAAFDVGEQERDRAGRVRGQGLGAWGVGCGLSTVGVRADG
jgi:hypothetical protein